MTIVFCDICGKQVKNDYSDVVAVTFNSYSLNGFKNGFKFQVGRMKMEDRELELCVDCAKNVVAKVEELFQASQDEKEKGDQNDANDQSRRSAKGRKGCHPA